MSVEKEISTEDTFNEFSNKEAVGDKPEELEVEKVSEGATVLEGAKEKDTGTRDPLAEASEEVKALVAGLRDNNNKLTHKVKSDDGRVSALHKKLAVFEAANKEKSVSVTEFTNAFTSKDSWKEFSEGNPELAAPMEEFMRGMAQTADKNLEVVTASNKELTAQAEGGQEERTRSMIEAAHPDWLDMLADTNYNAWLVRQPPTVQAIMQEGTVEDSIALLDMYKEFRDLSSKAITPPSGNPVADLKDKRDRQLQAGSQPPAKGGSAPPISEKDTSSFFNYFANKKAS